VNPYARQYYHN